MDIELKSWAVGCAWLFFFVVAAPELISAKSTTAVVAGLVLAAVLLRFTVAYVKDVRTYVEVKRSIKNESK